MGDSEEDIVRDILQSKDVIFDLLTNIISIQETCALSFNLQLPQVGASVIAACHTFFDNPSDNSPVVQQLLRQAEAQACLTGTSYILMKSKELQDVVRPETMHEIGEFIGKTERFLHRLEKYDEEKEFLSRRLAEIQEICTHIITSVEKIKGFENDVVANRQLITSRESLRKIEENWKIAALVIAAVVGLFGIVVAILVS